MGCYLCPLAECCRYHWIACIHSDACYTSFSLIWLV